MDSEVSFDGPSSKRYSISVQATEQEKQQVVDSGVAEVDERVTKLRNFMVGWFFSHHKEAPTIESDEPFVYECPKCTQQTQYFVHPADDYVLSLCLATPCIRQVLHLNEEVIDSDVDEELEGAGANDKLNMSTTAKQNSLDEIESVDSEEIN